MRYKLKAPVTSTGRLEAETEIRTNEYFMRLVPNEEGFLSRLEVETDAPDYADCLSGCLPMPEGSKAPFSITIRTDHKYHDKLEAILQYYESVGSFWLAIELPDNEEEKSAMTLSGCEEIREWFERRIPISNHMIMRLVALETDCQSLVYPMSFFREANRYYGQLRYISAFTHFYYYLEYMYANGKTNDHKVTAEFKSNPQLMKGVSQTWDRLKDDRHHWEKLRAQMAAKGCPESVEGMVELLVLMRGELHHASHRKQPFLDLRKERDYQSLAFASMSICTLTFADAFDAAWQRKPKDTHFMRFERGVDRQNTEDA
jgi:hypothetical protein